MSSTSEARAADDGGVEPYPERIDRLAERAEREKRAYSADDPDDPERALGYVSEGLGPSVSLYVELRTGGRMAAFTEREYRRLEGAMNDYLDLYVRCYGHDLEHDYPLRVAAELLVETHDARAVAEVLTRTSASG